SIQTGTTVDRAMSAYGQAIAVTNFQMMQGFTAVANGGKMMKLNYIQKTVDADGKVKETKPTVVSEPITSSTANQVLEMMRDVVEVPEYGTGYGVFNIDGYHVSANTGTAEIFNHELGTYEKDAYVTSVVQIAPTEDPQYIMYVTVKKPQMPDGVNASRAEIG